VWPDTILERLDFAMQYEIKVWIMYRGGTVVNRWRPIVPKNWIGRPVLVAAIDAESDELKHFKFERIDAVSRTMVQRMPEIPREQVVQQLQAPSTSLRADTLHSFKSYFLDSQDEGEIAYVSDLVYNGVTKHLGIGKQVSGSEVFALIAKAIRRSPRQLTSITLSTLDQCQDSTLERAISSSGIRQFGLPRLYMNEPAVRGVMRLIDSTSTLEEVVVTDSCKMGKRAWSGFEHLLSRKQITLTNQLPTFSQKSPSKPLARLGRFDIRSSSMPVKEIASAQHAVSMSKLTRGQSIDESLNLPNGNTPKKRSQTNKSGKSSPNTSKSPSPSSDPTVAAVGSEVGRVRRSNRQRKTRYSGAYFDPDEDYVPDDEFEYSPRGVQQSNSSPLHMLQSSTESLGSEQFNSEYSEDDTIEDLNSEIHSDVFEHPGYHDVDGTGIVVPQPNRLASWKRHKSTPKRSEFSESGQFAVVKCIDEGGNGRGERGSVRCRIVYPDDFNPSWNVQGVPYVIRHPGKYILCERIETVRRTKTPFYTCKVAQSRVHDIGFEFDPDDPYKYFGAAEEFGLRLPTPIREKENPRSPTPPPPPPTTTPQVDKGKMPMSDIQTTGITGLEDLREIDYKELFLEAKPIGNGAFGVVYRGFWRGAPVAVKRLRVEEVYKNDGDRFLKEFRAEAKMMNLLANHPNVIRLVGVCTKPPNFCLVSPLAQHGSMEDLLMSPKGKHLPEKVLWQMARDAASGILHLHFERVIHRDIALRNMLVGENYRVYVNDFGMSRLKTTESNYSKTVSALGPVKNMAPEAILEKKYSEASDAYSFGTLLWQLTTRKHPYSDLDALEVVIETSKGTLQPPPIPDNMHPVVARLVGACWDPVPSQRPNFQQIFNTLHMLHARTPDPVPIASRPAPVVHTHTAAASTHNVASSSNSRRRTARTAAAPTTTTSTTTPAGTQTPLASLLVTPPVLLSPQHSSDRTTKMFTPPHSPFAADSSSSSSTTAASPSSAWHDTAATTGTALVATATSPSAFFSPSQSNSSETQSDSLPGSFSQPNSMEYDDFADTGYLV